MKRLAVCKSKLGHVGRYVLKRALAATAAALAGCAAVSTPVPSDSPGLPESVSAVHSVIAQSGEPEAASQTFALTIGESLLWPAVNPSLLYVEPETILKLERRELERGGASWYGPGFHGRRTANGERYDMNALTAAHKTLPFGTMVRVKSLVNGREVVVRITDRGPFSKSRVIDLSRAAAAELGMLSLGFKQVALMVAEGDGSGKPVIVVNRRLGR